MWKKEINLLRVQAKEILETWDKATLIETLVDGMTSIELGEFIKKNEICDCGCDLPVKDLDMEK